MVGLLRNRSLTQIFIELFKLQGMEFHISEAKVIFTLQRVLPLKTRQDLTTLWDYLKGHTDQDKGN